MADVKVTVGAEIDKNSLKTVEQELAQAGGVLGGGESKGGKKSPIDHQIEAMSRLADVMKEIMKAMNDGTKAVTQQVTLREKELQLLKEGNKLGRNGWSPESGAPVEEDDAAKKRRYAFRGAHNIGRAISAVGSLAMSGGSLQSGISFGGAVANAIAPEIAPIINAVSGIAINALDKDDRVKEAALRGYQVGGASGGNMLLDPDNLTNRSRKEMGFNAERFSALQTGLSRRQGDARDIETVMRGENEFGLGSEMAGLQTSGRRMGALGNNEDPSKLFGAAFALTVGESLGRGRLGEIMSQLTSAINSNTRATTDVAATTNRFMFISQLGDQFKGDTGASREMGQAIGGLSQGSTPYTQYTMLKAAGLGSGASYGEAWLKSQRGMDTQGGVNSEDIIKQNFGQYVERYANGSDAEKASIVMLVSRMTGMNGYQVEVILKRLSQGGMSSVNLESGQAGFNERLGSTTKDPILDLHRQQANAESAASWFSRGIRWLGGQDKMGTMDGSGGDGGLGTRNRASGGSRISGDMRSKLAPYAQQYGVPMSFLENWINLESGGNIGSTTKYNERGYFQIMGGYDAGHPFKGSQADMLGMSESAHKSLSTDQDASLKWGVKSVAFLRKQAEKARDRFGLQWSDQDMWRLTKMEHGGSANVNNALERSTKQLGHTPRDWSEMNQAAYSGAGAQERGVLNNANKMVVEVQVFDRRATATITQKAGMSNAPGQNSSKR